MWNKVFDLSMPLPGNQTRPTTSSQNVETDQHRSEYDFRGRLRDCSWLLLNQEGFGLIQSARKCDTNPWMKRSEAINISLPTANTVHLVAQGRFRRHFQEGEEALPLFHTKKTQSRQRGARRAFKGVPSTDPSGLHHWRKEDQADHRGGPF